MPFCRVTCKLRLKCFRGIPCEEKGGWAGVEVVVRGMAPKEVKKGNTYLYIVLNTEQETKSGLE